MSPQNEFTVRTAITRLTLRHGVVFNKVFLLTAEEEVLDSQEIWVAINIYLSLFTQSNLAKVFRDFTVSNLSIAAAYITQCNSYIGASGGCDTSLFEISNITWANITGTVANNTLAYIQCSGSAPCDDISVVDVNVKTIGGPFVNCSNVDPLGVMCNTPAP
jgi:hypothetical protein